MENWTEGKEYSKIFLLYLIQAGPKSYNFKTKEFPSNCSHRANAFFTDVCSIDKSRRAFPFCRKKRSEKHYNNVPLSSGNVALLGRCKFEWNRFAERVIRKKDTREIRDFSGRDIITASLEILCFSYWEATGIFNYLHIPGVYRAIRAVSFVPFHHRSSYMLRRVNASEWDTNFQSSSPLKSVTSCASEIIDW